MKKLLAATTAAFAIVPFTQAISYNLSDDPTVNGASVMKFSNAPITQVTLGSTAKTLYTGAFSLLADDTTTVAVEAIKFDTYCIEPTANLTPFDNPYTGVLPETYFTPVIGNDLRQLWQFGYGWSLLNKDMSAGFQLAIWEMAYDNGALNLTGGTFSVQNFGNVNVQNAATWFLSNYSLATPDPDLFILTDNQQNRDIRQDVFWDETPNQGVPEPFTLAFAGLGLAAALRRRSSKK